MSTPQTSWSGAAWTGAVPDNRFVWCAKSGSHWAGWETSIKNDLFDGLAWRRGVSHVGPWCRAVQPGGGRLVSGAIVLLFISLGLLLFFADHFVHLAVRQGGTDSPPPALHPVPLDPGRVISGADHSIELHRGARLRTAAAGVRRRMPLGLTGGSQGKLERGNALVRGVLSRSGDVLRGRVPRPAASPGPGACAARRPAGPPRPATRSSAGSAASPAARVVTGPGSYPLLTRGYGAGLT